MSQGRSKNQRTWVVRRPSAPLPRLFATWQYTKSRDAEDHEDRRPRHDSHSHAVQPALVNLWAIPLIVARTWNGAKQTWQVSGLIIRPVTNLSDISLLACDGPKPPTTRLAFPLTKGALEATAKFELQLKKRGTVHGERAREPLIDADPREFSDSRNSPYRERLPPHCSPRGDAGQAYPARYPQQASPQRPEGQKMLNRLLRNIRGPYRRKPGIRNLIPDHGRARDHRQTHLLEWFSRNTIKLCWRSCSAYLRLPVR